MTPTFAAGLGVVIAAAVGVPAPKVVLSTVPDLGQPCRLSGCGSGGNGTLATRPGTRPLLNSPQKRFGSSRAAAGPGGTAGSGVAGRSSGRVRVQYRTLGQDWGGGFTGEIILTSRSGKPLTGWTLTFSYPQGQIEEVWAGTLVPHGMHTATVSAAQYHPGWFGSDQAAIMFSVSGRAAPPASCTINGHSCHFTISQGGPVGQPAPRQGD